MSLRGVRTALVIAPHPDDEAIGAAGLIAMLRRTGARVRILIVTDGAASHAATARWPKRRLIGARRRESRQAALRLGLIASDVTFLGLPDGSLDRSPDRVRRALARTLAADRRHDLIVGPCAADGHPDHRAVASALSRLGRGARQITYRVWPPTRQRRSGPSVIARMASSFAKRALIRTYATQTKRIVDDPGGFTIAHQELDAFSRPIETFGVVRR